MEGKAIASKMSVLFSFLIMVATNALTNFLPLNGKITVELFDSYPNLLYPAKYTHIIRALILLLLALYTGYQLASRPKYQLRLSEEFMVSIRILASLSMLFRSVWIVSWHYDYITLSVMMTAAIWICLIIINHQLYKESLSKSERLFLRIPFSVFLGWITISMLLNITVMLVSIRFRGFQIAESTWAIGFLIITLVFILYIGFRNRDVYYCLITLWFYIGILVKHISAAGHGGKYPEIIVALIICIVLQLALLGYLFISNKKHSI